MVVRVAERARESGADAVIVATDDVRIETVVRSAGFDVVMTRRDHASGTDRLAEVVEHLGLDADAILVNVQGDEPFVEPGMVRALALLLDATPEAAIATACNPRSFSIRTWSRSCSTNRAMRATSVARLFPGRGMPLRLAALRPCLPDCLHIVI